jgi:hypothetical protein
MAVWPGAKTKLAELRRELHGEGATVRHVARDAGFEALRQLSSY